jgi:hypothetical protein
MSYWILTQKASVISRTTVQRITNLEKQSDRFKSGIDEFDTSIKTHFKEDSELPFLGFKPNLEDWYKFMGFDADFQEEFKKVINDPTIPEADKDCTPDFDDTYLNMELAIPRDSEGPEYARVTKRLKDKDGLPIGTAVVTLTGNGIARGERYR